MFDCESEFGFQTECLKGRKSLIRDLLGHRKLGFVCVDGLMSLQREVHQENLNIKGVVNINP